MTRPPCPHHSPQTLDPAHLHQLPRGLGRSSSQHHTCSHGKKSAASSSDNSRTLCETEAPRPAGGPTEKHRNPHNANPKLKQCHPAHRAHTHPHDAPSMHSGNTRARGPAQEQRSPRHEVQNPVPVPKPSDANPCPSRREPRECMNQRHNPSHRLEAGSSSTATQATGRWGQQDASARHMHGANLREQPRNHGHRTHPVPQGHIHHLSRERDEPAPRPHHFHAAACSIHGNPQPREETVHRNESIHGNPQQQPRWVYGPPLPVVMMEHRAAMKGRRRAH